MWKTLGLLFIAAHARALAPSAATAPRLIDLPLQEPGGRAPLARAAVERRLEGRSVALYFAAAWCPACRRFLPQLAAWRAARAELGGGGAETRAEIVFVSSDRTAAEFDAHHAALGGDVLAVPFAEHAAADALKRHCGVWAGVESMRLGARGRRSGVPALAVLGQDGGVLLHLDAEREGARCLAAWDPAACEPWAFEGA